MTKRKLSDLIREEAQKPPQEERDADEGATAEEPPKARAKRTTKAELEEIVSELTETLTAARQQSDTLQKQVDTLEAALKEQTTLVQTLQGQQQKARQENEQTIQNLQQELQTRAKNSDVEKQEQLNQKLQAEVAELQRQRTQQQEELQQLRTRNAELEQQLNQPQTQSTALQPIADSSPQKLKLSRAAYGLKQRPLGRNDSQTLSDKDLGWFD